MTTARDVMHQGARCVQSNETVADAARIMADEQVGSLPICGPDDKLKGLITDRDIVVKVIARGRNPESCPAGDLAEGHCITIRDSDDAQSVLDTMSHHQVHRLPVINEDKRLVGMVAVADVARSLPKESTGQLVAALSVD
jgi:CBS domain-containing protein